MPELKAYSCDSGCGAHIMMCYGTDSPANHGWYTTYAPVGKPTIYSCSLRCLIVSAASADERDQKALSP